MRSTFKFEWKLLIVALNASSFYFKMITILLRVIFSIYSSKMKILDY
jgi:hypothetical protein